MNREVLRKEYTIPNHQESKRNINTSHGRNSSRGTFPPPAPHRAATFHTSQSLPNKSELIMPSIPAKEVSTCRGYHSLGAYDSTGDQAASQENLPSIYHQDTNESSDVTQPDGTTNNRMDSKLANWPHKHNTRGQHKLQREKTISSDPRFSKLENLLQPSTPNTWRSSQSMVSFKNRPDIIDSIKHKNVDQAQASEKLLLPALRKHNHDNSGKLNKEVSSLSIDVIDEWRTA